MHKLSPLQSDCHLANDLDDQLEMCQLRLFILKYRLAAICDVNFPTPSELLSKISLRTLRHLSSFGGAAVCSLHLHFLCKSQFQICKKLLNHEEEVKLNVSRLHGLFSGCNSATVCEELKLDPEKYYIVKDDCNRVRLRERDYQLQKTDRNLGLTISAKLCSDNGIRAEVRAIKDKGACVEVGDLVISVDNKLVSSLKSAEEVQVLLRRGTILVLRRRDAIIPQYIKPRPHSISTAIIPDNKTTFGSLSVSAKVQKSTKNRSHSMDRISDVTSCTKVTRRERQNGSARSSPTRSIHRSNYQSTSLNGHSVRQMSHSAYEKSSSKREDYHRNVTTNGIISLSDYHLSDGTNEQLLKTINELVSTEENFVRDVQKLVNQYLKPTNLPLLETADRLLRIQTSFLLSLLDAAGDVAHSFAVSQQQLRDSLIRISALFVNKCGKFKIYSDYSAAYLRFQQNKNERNDITARLEKLNISGEQSESAQSLLIKPIQRVLKYPLFLQQIRDNCLKGSVERQQGEQALTRMQALAEYVNEMQRLTEQYGKIIEEISAKNGAISRMNFSQLLMFAHVNWLNCPENRSRPIASVAFVFTTLILIFCPTLSKNKCKVYRILPIIEVEVSESNGESSPSSEYVFILIHIGSTREPVYQLCCCQAEIKNHFIKSIRKAATAIT
uniref:DH domain-containing protein n=1 Tax=Setaria digitata TaxID=48799 RepID=A0A915PJ22_9BILA